MYKSSYKSNTVGYLTDKKINILIHETPNVKEWQKKM